VPAYDADYVDGLSDLPDWRITCFFVDRRRRHRGVSSAAPGRALDEIDRLGGGVVESYPDAVDGRPVSGSFLHNGTLALFERHGFERTRRIGKTRWVVRKTSADLRRLPPIRHRQRHNCAAL
jgi:GNAT superfamily N-acetyltransferase